MDAVQYNTNHLNQKFIKLCQNGKWMVCTLFQMSAFSVTKLIGFNNIFDMARLLTPEILTQYSD